MVAWACTHADGKWILEESADHTTRVQNHSLCIAPSRLYCCAPRQIRMEAFGLSTSCR